MNFFIAFLLFFSGMCALSAFINLVIGPFFLKDRRMTVFGLFAAAVSGYTFLNALLYLSVDLAQYFAINRVQSLFSMPAIFLFALFIQIYTGKIRPWILWPAGLVFLGLVPLRLLDEHLLFYTRVDGLEALVLPWGERLSRLVGTASWVFQSVSLGIFLVYAHALVESLIFLRKTPGKRSLWLVISVNVFWLCVLNDIAVMLAGFSRIYLAEGGFFAFVLLMTMALADETLQIVRLRRELALRERLVEASRDGILLADPQGRIRFVNPAFC